MGTAMSARTGGIIAGGVTGFVGGARSIEGGDGAGAGVGTGSGRGAGDFVGLGECVFRW